MSEEIKKSSVQNMNLNQDNSRRLKVIAWIFGMLFLGALVYIVNAYNNHKNIQEFLIEEKEAIEGELARIENEYDLKKSENDSLNVKLSAQHERISVLRDSVQQMEASVRLLRKYKKLINTLKEEKKQLFHLADSLDRMNQVLKAQRDTAEMKLVVEKKLSQKLANQNEKLAKDVEEGSKLDVLDLRAEAVRVSSSGKVSETSRAKRTDKIRVCMTIARNKLTEIGEKNIYVRVATPNEILLGKQLGNNRTFMVDGVKLQYSAVSSVYYEQDPLDVCVYVDGTESEFVKGKYFIAVYSDGYFIDETVMELK
jgi:myosin heavy subunit